MKKRLTVRIGEYVALAFASIICLFGIAGVVFCVSHIVICPEKVPFAAIVTLACQLCFTILMLTAMRDLVRESRR